MGDIVDIGTKRALERAYDDAHSHMHDLHIERENAIERLALNVARMAFENEARSFVDCAAIVGLCALIGAGVRDGLGLVAGGYVLARMGASSLAAWRFEQLSKRAKDNVRCET